MSATQLFLQQPEKDGNCRYQLNAQAGRSMTPLSHCSTWLILSFWIIRALYVLIIPQRSGFVKDFLLTNEHITYTIKITR